MTTPLFPGGVAVSDLAVYDWEAVDGRCGGSPHLHTASSEGYVVVGGSGVVHTLSADGVAEHPLSPGDVVWFSPGTVHRLVNDGGSSADRRDAELRPARGGRRRADLSGARARRPRGVRRGGDAARRARPRGRGQGAARSRDAGLSRAAGCRRAEGPSALAALHARAARLVQPRVAEWRATWEATVAAEVERTRRQLDALGDGLPGALGAASVVRATPDAGDPAFGMCGRLTTWDWEH